MGSRYDVAVFIGVSLADFEKAVADRYILGDRVDGPWREPDGVSVAGFAAGGRHGVVVASAPMKTPRGIDTRLAKRMGAIEGAFATVWDSVSTYELTVVGAGVDRHLSVEADLGDAQPGRYASGQRLPEEPDGHHLDESVTQTVLIRRYGVNPAAVGRLGWEWRALVPAAGR